MSVAKLDRISMIPLLPAMAKRSTKRAAAVSAPTAVATVPPLRICETGWTVERNLQPYIKLAIMGNVMMELTQGESTFEVPGSDSLQVWLRLARDMTLLMRRECLGEK